MVIEVLETLNMPKLIKHLLDIFYCKIKQQLILTTTFAS